MKKLKWYFNHGANCELYSVLFDDNKFLLVQNDTSKLFSFGLKCDFGTLYGFPVNQSCLTLKECNQQLRAFIRIDKSYLDSSGKIAEQQIERWQNMLKALKAGE